MQGSGPQSGGSGGGRPGSAQGEHRPVKQRRAVTGAPQDRRGTLAASRQRLLTSCVCRQVRSAWAGPPRLAPCPAHALKAPLTGSTGGRRRHPPRRRSRPSSTGHTPAGVASGGRQRAASVSPSDLCQREGGQAAPPSLCLVHAPSAAAGQLGRPAASRYRNYGLCPSGRRQPWLPACLHGITGRRRAPMAMPGGAPTMCHLALSSIWQRIRVSLGWLHRSQGLRPTCGVAAGRAGPHQHALDCKGEQAQPGRHMAIQGGRRRGRGRSVLCQGEQRQAKQRERSARGRMAGRTPRYRRPHAARAAPPSAAAGGATWQGGSSGGRGFHDSSCLAHEMLERCVRAGGQSNGRSAHFLLPVTTAHAPQHPARSP